jgi:uracil phosphoribosyltransferase
MFYKCFGILIFDVIESFEMTIGLLLHFRSGESMEAGLRDCCRSIRIGKILVESDVDTHEAHVVYARFPDDIRKRKVILMYPIMSTGNTVIKSVNVLKEHLVPEENIILANLFCTPHAVGSVLSTFPEV